MFKLFTRNRPAPDLLTSSLFTERTFYSNFMHDLKRCRKEIIIESPYLTVPRVQQLMPTFKKLVKHNVKIRVNTRFPGHHDKLLSIQAYQATKLLKSVGVRVFYYYDYHHRKLAVLDGKILYEGSLNILSQCRSREIMRRIESEQLTKQMINFVGLKRVYW